jgi:adenylate cyclase
MMVGNLGSRKRFDFTAIGDSVNLASRVEGLNNYLGTAILITDAVQGQLTSPLDVLPMGKVRVVGKAHPVALFPVDLGVEEQVRREWGAALRHFENRDWDAAEKSFDSCSASPELRVAAQFYSEQIKYYRLQPPTADWSGELVMSAK